MDLLKALNEVGMGRTTNGCTIKMILDSVDNPEQVDALLRDTFRSAAGMSRVLTEAGFKISPGTVTRHRRNECACKR